MSGEGQQVQGSPLTVSFGGHSTLLIDLDGVRILTDPLFRSYLLHLQRHAPPIDLEHYASADLLLISHSHLDHLDRRSLKLLPKDITAVVPNDTVKLMRGLGFTDVRGVSAGETIEAHGLELQAIHALHGGSRMPWHQTAETLGFVARGSRSFYFAGDTDIFDEMSDLGPDLDLALMPVWGWGPKLGEGHLDPGRAAEAVELIRPKIAVPIHWGGYLPATLAKRRPDLLTDPPRDFKRLVEDLDVGTRVELIEPGDTTALHSKETAT